MDQRLQQYCSIKLHYKNGIATVAFRFNEVFGVIHSYKAVAANLHEVFSLLKAYERFIDQEGRHLLVARFAAELDINIRGKSINQVVNEISEAIQKLSKNMA